MSLLSSLSKHIFLFLTLTFIWIAICWLFEGRAFMSATNAERGPSLLMFLIGEAIIVAIVQGEDRKKTLRGESAQVMKRIAPIRVALFERLTQIPDFSLTHWCVLPSSTGAKALAVNADASCIALLDYKTPIHKHKAAPSIKIKMVSIADITSVRLEQTVLGGSRTMWFLFAPGEPPLRLASELLGPAGLPLSHSQLLGSAGQEVSPPRDAPPIASPMPVEEQRRVNRLTLILTTKGDDTSTEEFPFLLGEATTSDDAYLFALQNATHWQRLFEGHRSDSVGASPKQM